MKQFLRAQRKFFLWPFMLLARLWGRVQRFLLPHLPADWLEPFIEAQIEAVEPLVKAELHGNELYRRVFQRFEARGMHLTPNHFYSPIPDTRTIGEQGESHLPGLDMNLPVQLEFLQSIFPRYRAEYDDFATQPSPHLLAHEFVFGNRSFDGVDALALYCMARHFHPRQIVEVGSGWSTRVAARAALANANTRLTSIEPYPAPVLQDGFPGLSNLLVEKVEKVGLDIFTSLEAGDILFIDTSHVVKTGGDVNFLYLEVLPRLKAGVVVHIHDIFLPQDYPKWWIAEQLYFWNEQYLLQAFLAFNQHFRVLFASHLMRQRYFELVRQTFSHCPVYDGCSSFWIEKVM